MKECPAGCQEVISGPRLSGNKHFDAKPEERKGKLVSRLLRRAEARTAPCLTRGLYSVPFTRHHPRPPVLTQGPFLTSVQKTPNIPEKQLQISMTEFHEPMLSPGCLLHSRSWGGGGAVNTEQREDAAPTLKELTVERGTWPTKRGRG